MTQQDYSNDLVFRSNTDLGVKTPTASISFNTKDAGEIAKFTEDGFYYKGEFVDDAGEVHRLMKDVLNGICYKQLCVELLEWLELYNNCCNTDIDSEDHERGLYMADRARAALGI